MITTMTLASSICSRTRRCYGSMWWAGLADQYRVLMQPLRWGYVVYQHLCINNSCYKLLSRWSDPSACSSHCLLQAVEFSIYTWSLTSQGPMVTRSMPFQWNIWMTWPWTCSQCYQTRSSVTHSSAFWLNLLCVSALASQQFHHQPHNWHLYYCCPLEQSLMFSSSDQSWSSNFTWFHSFCSADLRRSAWEVYFQTHWLCQSHTARRQLRWSLVSHVYHLCGCRHEWIVLMCEVLSFM